MDIYWIEPSERSVGPMQLGSVKKNKISLSQEAVDLVNIVYVCFTDDDVSVLQQGTPAPKGLFLGPLNVKLEKEGWL